MFEFLEDLFDRPGRDRDGRTGKIGGLLDRFHRRDDRHTCDRWHDDHDDPWDDDDERYARTRRDGDRRPPRRRDPDFDWD
ncbi:MAG TPA: hypothetical protein VKV26_18095 [Dehalococcoidia bacterium]|nr:hypothetical protein [Dehalococcoidia bacterium]